MPKKRSEPSQPSLDEMLCDPIVWMVMQSDKVSENQLRSLLKNVATHFIAADAANAGATVAPPGYYRRGVGIMLLNHRNEVLVGQRADAKEDAWQMPQGGIDGTEEPRKAALRELREEIGTDKVQIVAESKNWLRYDLPPELRKRWNDRWHGQEQKWFVMRLLGDDSDINVATEQPEFSAWKWVSLEALPDLIVSFKRQLYVDLLQGLRESGAIADVGRPGPTGP